MEKKIIIRFGQGDYQRSRGSSLWISVNDFDEKGVPVIAELFLAIPFFSTQETQCKIFMMQLGQEPRKRELGQQYLYEKKIE
jgi:hypothetical protein